MKSRSRTFLRLAPPPLPERANLALLPGPVVTSKAVNEAFTRLAVSHRTEAFMTDFAETRHMLCRLVGTRHAEILLGSGTLANDVIAAQLSLISGSGLVLSNGEFGDRLIDHAARFGLRCNILRSDWGSPFDDDCIRRALEKNRNLDWLWAVHCETSSGILNDVDRMQQLCAPRGIRVCLDCISSIGTIPVNLSEIFLASGVSGKGLASFPGLSIIFYNHEIKPAWNALPRYLDLALYRQCEGVPFTNSSNLVYALKAALQQFDAKKFQAIQEVSAWLRTELTSLGFHIVGPPALTSPAVNTIALPESISSEWVGRKLNEAGYQLSYRSRYLRSRNWIQICLMGEVELKNLEHLVEVMSRLCATPGARERAADKY